MKIKIQKRADKIGEKTHYKKGQVVVSKWSDCPSIMVASDNTDEVGDLLCYEKNNVQSSYNYRHLRLATPSEKKLLGTRKFAEVEFIEDKPKEVKQKIQNMPEKAETNQTEVETLKAEIERLKEKNKELDFQKSRLIIELDELSSDYLGKMELIQSLESENEKQFSRVAKVEKLVDNLSDENYVQERKIDSLHKEIETITKYNLEQLKLILKND